jgi:endoglucanase
VLIVLGLVAILGPWGVPALAASGAAAGASTSGLPGLVVIGNHLVNAKGNEVLLHGVNRSGTEYACVQGWGIFDGPSSAASVAAIAAWHANVVRIPLNEDCWLDINGVDPAYAGARYRDAIVAYVDLLHHDGMYAELSLTWRRRGGTKRRTSRPPPTSPTPPRCGPRSRERSRATPT